MNNLSIILKKEFHAFLGSDKGLFITYIILIFAWSGLFANTGMNPRGFTPSPWWLFFSVVIVGSMANSVFVTERMTGALEILLTSGLSRRAILYGKVLFLVLISGAIGLCVFGVTFIWTRVLNTPVTVANWQDLFAYISAVFLCSSLSAWMTVRLSNPRLIHFICMLVLGVLWAVYISLSTVFMFVFAYPQILSAACLVLGFVFLANAERAMHHERVIRPMVL